MNPVGNLVEKNIAFFEQMDDLRAVQSHLALESWVNDNIPVAGEAFREFVKSLYQRNLLVKGELVARRAPGRPRGGSPARFCC